MEIELLMKLAADLTKYNAVASTVWMFMALIIFTISIVAFLFARLYSNDAVMSRVFAALFFIGVLVSGIVFFYNLTKYLLIELSPFMWYYTNFA